MDITPVALMLATALTLGISVEGEVWQPQPEPAPQTITVEPVASVAADTCAVFTLNHNPTTVLIAETGEYHTADHITVDTVTKSGDWDDTTIRHAVVGHYLNVAWDSDGDAWETADLIAVDVTGLGAVTLCKDTP